MADIEKPETAHDDEPRSTASGVAELKKVATIDTVHTDEAMKVLATYSGEETWDEKEEKLVRRKIDKRLLPILCATYGLVCNALGSLEVRPLKCVFSGGEQCRGIELC